MQRSAVPTIWQQRARVTAGLAIALFVVFLLLRILAGVLS